MKSVLIVGLGRFGRHMARKLSELGNEVMAVDINEERVNSVLGDVTHAQIGDATKEHFVETLGVRNFDLCVVAIGDNFQSSLEATAMLKDHGAPFVLARATREVHAKFLLRNGADDVVYVEKEMAIRSAVKYSSDSVFDYIELTDNYAIYETSIPEHFAGKSILDLAVRRKYHISILAIKDGDTLDPMPHPDYRFHGTEKIFIMGDDKDIVRFIKLCDRD